MEISNENNSNSKDPNIIVLSNAGKPIYTRYEEDDEQITIACGCIQALIATTAQIDNSNNSEGGISSINAGKLKIVFLTSGSIILVAISDSNGIQNETSNIYLRLQLEYIYLQILFTLTKQVQDIYIKNPSFDLRRMLGNDADKIMNHILYKMNTDTGCFLTSGIEVVSPISYKIREEVNSILVSNIHQLQNENDQIGILYVLVLLRNKYLVTLVQPKYRQYYLYPSDLQLILNFLQSQDVDEEHWFPLCLPRFNASGYVYGYTSTMHAGTGLSLCVICGDNSDEQFQLLSSFVLNVEVDLGIVMQRYDSDSILSSRKGLNSEDSNYNKEDNDITAASQEEQQNHKEDCHPIEQNQSTKDLNEKNAKHNSPLIKSIIHATSKEKQQSLWDNYSNIAMALHFLFRFDVFINPTANAINQVNTTSDNGTSIGSNGTTPISINNNTTLTQCYSPPLDFPFTTTKSKQHVWSIYQRLALRLRLGGSSSSVEESMLSYDSSYDGHDGIQKECLAINLLESPPAVHGVTYLLDGTELYIGLNGAFFELYAGEFLVY